MEHSQLAWPGVNLPRRVRGLRPLPPLFRLPAPVRSHPCPQPDEVDAILAQTQAR